MLPPLFSYILTICAILHITIQTVMVKFIRTIFDIQNSVTKNSIFYIFDIQNSRTKPFSIFNKLNSKYDKPLKIMHFILNLIKVNKCLILNNKMLKPHSDLATLKIRCTLQKGKWFKSMHEHSDSHWCKLNSTR